MNPYLQILRNYYYIVHEEGEEAAEDWLVNKVKLPFAELIFRLAMELNQTVQRPGREL